MTLSQAIKRLAGRFLGLKAPEAAEPTPEPSTVSIEPVSDFAKALGMLNADRKEMGYAGWYVRSALLDDLAADQALWLDEISPWMQTCGPWEHLGPGLTTLADRFASREAPLPENGDIQAWEVVVRASNPADAVKRCLESSDHFAAHAVEHKARFVGMATAGGFWVFVFCIPDPIKLLADGWKR